MRIAFLCKRRYMGKDVILDRYARLYEIPFQLARLDHEVRGFCLSYRKDESEGHWQHDASPGLLSWQSDPLSKLVLPSLVAHPFRLLNRLRSFRPDVIIGASDIPHLVWGSWLAKHLNKPFIADLYDNFEGFGQARLPGMVAMLRRSVKAAALVLTTSEPLRSLVVDTYGATGTVIAMPSSIDKDVFHPRNKISCREALGLPKEAKLIGTAGNLSREKGADCLFEAWTKISRDPDLHLVLAGPLTKGVSLPTGPQVHYLGMLEHNRVAELFCALDVGVVSVLNTPFGRYCFPQKVYEMLACGLPLVAADVGAMSDLLKNSPQLLFEPNNGDALASALTRQLRYPMRVDLPIRDWNELIQEIEPVIRRLTVGVDS